MARPYSEDLRWRVISAVLAGLSTRAAARRFGIGESTAGEWVRAYRADGRRSARPMGAPRRSKLDAHEAFIRALIMGTKDITLSEIAARLAGERGVKAGTTCIWVFLERCGLSFKKRLRTPPSKTVQTSAPRVRSGSRTSPTSIPAV